MRREVTGGDVIDIKKDEPETTTHEGFYLEAKIIQTQIGKQYIYKFKRQDGRIFGIYGFTNLNIRMENIMQGDYCFLTYLGTKNIQTKFGMKDVHMVRVEVDDDIAPEEHTEVDPF